MFSEVALGLHDDSSEGNDDRHEADQNASESFPRKRRRLTDGWSEEAFPKYGDMSQTQTDLNTSGSHADRLDDASAHNETPTTLAQNNREDKNVAPFLAKHIRDQYSPMNRPRPMDQPGRGKNPNSRYCYRHRPDLKCRRQADEPSMDQMQRVGVDLL